MPLARGGKSGCADRLKTNFRKNWRASLFAALPAAFTHSGNFSRECFLARRTGKLPIQNHCQRQPKL
jgi:GH25 family lysozyme M1 (1,4-beta-N-acetylmuramidase)